MSATDFSSELRQELQSSIEGYVTARDTDIALARLRAVTKRVCHEAHGLGMKPETMVIALRQLYESLGYTDARTEHVRRHAYDLLLTDCIHAYYEAAQQPAS